MTAHLDAIRETANRHRRERAETKARLAAVATTEASRELCADLLLGDTPVALARMPVADLVGACRGTGSYRAGRMLLAAGIPDGKVLGQLTLRQELALAGQLRHAHHDQLALA